jgi:hypothetical protein
MHWTEWMLVGMVAVALLVWLVVEHQSDKAFDRLCNGIIDSSKKGAKANGKQ